MNVTGNTMMKKRRFLTISMLSVLVIVLSACGSSPKLSSFDRKADDLESMLESKEKKSSKLKAETYEEALTKARAAWEIKDADLAQAFYIIAFNFEPDNVQLLEEMAGIYRQLNKLDQVELCYKLILEQQPDNPQFLERAGLFFLGQKKLDKAQVLLTKAVAVDTTQWRSYNGLGIISDLAGDYKDAQKYFHQANAIKPNNPQILNNIGYSLYMDNQLKVAKSYFLKALKINSKFDRALYNYALVLARQKQYNKALTVLTKVMDVPKANNTTGYLAMKNGDYPEAEHYFNKALHLAPRFYRKAYENLLTLESRMYSPEQTDWELE